MASTERMLGAPGDRRQRAARTWSVCGGRSGPLLQEAVPHFEAPCFFTVDPRSLLTTSHFQEGLPEIPAEWLGREYSEAGLQLDDRGAAPARPASARSTTRPAGGRSCPGSSTRRCSPTAASRSWSSRCAPATARRGALVGLYRETGGRCSTPASSRCSRGGTGAAEGARHGLRPAQAREPDLPDAPGLVVLDARLAVVSASPLRRDLARRARRQGRRPAGARPRRRGPGPVRDRRPGRVPGACRAAAGSSLHGPGRSSATAGRRRVGRHRRRTTRAAGVTAGPGLRADPASATSRPGGPRLLQPARSRASWASPRDTVQQHLSNIFDKTGVRSRAELVGVLFHTHFEPRVRDNERRTAGGRASRPGPMAAS